VPNIAARVPHTASAAISNILGPLVIRIGSAGSIQELASIDQGVKKGIYAFRRHLTHRSLSNMFNMDYIDLNLLLAAHF
jgi:alanine dehydrogenase